MIRIASLLLIGAACAAPQQPPKKDRTGQPLVIVRNDGASPVSIEYWTANEWRKASVEPRADVSLAGERIRVATTRGDNAMVTVDLPVQGGKKYRVVWNKNAKMWDFSPAP